MWAHTTFQVDLQAAGSSADNEPDGLTGYPGIGPVTADDGRQLIIVSFDPDQWTPADLAGFADRLSLPWLPMPEAA